MASRLFLLFHFISKKAGVPKELEEHTGRKDGPVYSRDIP